MDDAQLLTSMVNYAEVYVLLPTDTETVNWVKPITSEVLTVNAPLEFIYTPLTLLLSVY